jgi:asparagine synthase (glutamine-hydrolysing)
MSAICGVFGRSSQSNVSAELALLLSGLSHRGIDGVSSWCKGNVGLGIQYLWVTPESKKEKLPYYDPDLQLAIVADIRLDNRAALLSRLSINNSTLSDSQIVLLGYKTWGKEVVQRLRGEFAIVIWDASQQQLILISDHCGIRSIYYYISDDYLVFASEIKALLALPFVPCKPQLKQIAKMDFYVQPETPGETYFEQIYALPSATIWTVTPDQTESLHTYWQPNPKHRITFKREEEYVEYFQALFADAIRGRLRSAYPIASTLSGGLDSSSITAMAASLLDKENQSLRTYSVIKAPEYADQCVDEQAFIDCFNDTPNLNRSYISDIWRGPFDDLEALISAGESPDFTSRHFHLSAFTAQMKQQGERVLMLGQYGEGGPSFNGQGYYSTLAIFPEPFALRSVRSTRLEWLSRQLK